ncbi:hypothetical protein BHE74_00010200, partial [Ensete ventricosum]
GDRKSRCPPPHFSPHPTIAGVAENDDDKGGAKEGTKKLWRLQRWKMSNFVGVLVSDPWLQSQFTQVELRSLRSKVSNLPTPCQLNNLNFYAASLGAWIDISNYKDTTLGGSEPQEDTAAGGVGR